MADIDAHEPGDGGGGGGAVPAGGGLYVKQLDLLTRFKNVEFETPVKGRLVLVERATDYETYGMLMASAVVGNDLVVTCKLGDRGKVTVLARAGISSRAACSPT